MFSALARLFRPRPYVPPAVPELPRWTFAAADAAGNRYDIRAETYRTMSEFADQGWAPVVEETSYRTQSGQAVTRISKGVYEFPGPAGETIRVTTDDPNAS